MRVTEEEGETLQRKCYTYKQLHDLQSRLMLIAGKAVKGKDEVDRFMLVNMLNMFSITKEDISLTALSTSSFGISVKV